MVTIYFEVWLMLSSRLHSDCDEERQYKYFSFTLSFTALLNGRNHIAVGFTSTYA
jgi:hypothetical protein